MAIECRSFVADDASENKPVTAFAAEEKLGTLIFTESMKWIREKYSRILRGRFWRLRRLPSSRHVWFSSAHLLFSSESAIMQSKATSVAQYLNELPAERRSAIEAIRKVILETVDGDIEEGMQYGMIGFYVPHRVYPAGYHCDPRQPLPYVCLASQKNYMSVYLMTCYGGGGAEETWFRGEWAKTGKKLDMGKSCVRFKRLEDLALDVIAAAIRRVPAREHIARYEAALAQNGQRAAGSSPAKSKAAKGKTVKASTVKASTAKKKAVKATAAKKKTVKASSTKRASTVARSGKKVRRKA